MSWNSSTLGSVCDLINRGIAPSYVDDGGILVLNQKCIRNHTVNYELSRRHDSLKKPVKEERLIRAGDVLVNSTGTGTLGRVALVLKEPLEPTTVDTHITIVRPKNGMFDKSFFGLMLISIEEKIKQAGEGSVGQTELSRVKLRDEFFVSYSSDISIQKKVADKLNAIFAEIDKATSAAEANAKNAEAIFQSYLANIFEDNASLTKKLKDCCLIKPPKKEARNLNDSDMVSFMPMETLGINHKFAIPNQERKLLDVSGSYTYFAEGDILLAKITPCFENGKLGIAKDLTNGIGFGSSEYIVFRPNPDIDSSWLYYFLNRSVFRENGAKHMSGAVGHKRVTKEFIEDSLLPVPSIDKQKKLVADIENVLTFTKSLLSSSKNKVRELSILKKSILSKAFNGESVKD